MKQTKKNYHTDVLIIGGGVIGVSCAYYLSKAGRSVRIIEKKTIGSGASYANLGLITPSYAVPLNSPGIVWQAFKWMFRKDSPLYIKPRVDFAFINWLLHFAALCNEKDMMRITRARVVLLDRSLQLLRELIKKEKLNCDWECHGLLKVFKTETGMKSYESYNNILKEFEFDGIPLYGKELTEKEPALRDDLFGAWFHDSDVQLRPDRLLKEWDRVNRRNGVLVEENCEFADFASSKNTIQSVMTPKGDFTADEFVVATGSWSPMLNKKLGIKIPIQPGKGYSITMKKPRLYPKHGLVLKERNVGVTAFKSGYRLGGTMELSGYNGERNLIRINAIRRAAAEYLKEPEGEQVEEYWYGWRPMTYDEMPIIDRSPVHKNLVLATGHGMMGVSMSTGTGKLVAELITGKTPHIDIVPFRFKRFSGG